MKSYRFGIFCVAVAATLCGLTPSAFGGTNVFTVNVSREHWADFGKIGGARLGGERMDKGPFMSTVAPPNAKTTMQRKPMSTSAGPVVGDTVKLGFLKYKGAKEVTPDSEWVVVEAKDMGKRITGNKDWSDEELKTDGKFFAVTFKVTNRTAANQYVDRFGVAVEDGKRRYFHVHADSSKFMPPDCVDFFDPIPPDLSRTFFALYEMPADAAGLTFPAHTFETFVHESTLPLKPGEEPAKTDLPLYTQPITLDSSSAAPKKR